MELWNNDRIRQQLPNVFMYIFSIMVVAVRLKAERRWLYGMVQLPELGYWVRKMRKEKNMRRYEDGQDRKLMKVVCNKCGRNLKVVDGYLKEYCFTADTVFGYFSNKDGVEHHFDLCEECYDMLTSQFLVPVEEMESAELL